MKRKLLFGFMGCGEIAVQTAKAMAQTGNCELAMVQDVNEEMARDLADKYNVPYCLTWEELLSHKELDAIYIATPHYLHAPGAIAAAQAGKHVLVEKPIATTLADTDGMIDAAAAAGVALAVAYATRFLDRTARIKRVIEEGALGTIVGVELGNYGYKPQSYWSGGWTGRVQTDWRPSKEKSGGGVFLMNLVHTIDMLRYVAGLEAVSVAASCDTFKTRIEVEDYIVAVVRYANGAIGVLRGATCVEGKMPPGALEGDRIIGVYGQILIGVESVQLFLSRPHGEFEAGRWHTMCVESPWGGRAEMMREISRAILAGRPVPVGAAEGRKSLEVCLAAYRSCETGQVVRLPMGAD